MCLLSTLCRGRIMPCRPSDYSRIQHFPSVETSVRNTSVHVRPSNRRSSRWRFESDGDASLRRPSDYSSIRCAICPMSGHKRTCHAWRMSAISRFSRALVCVGFGTATRVDRATILESNAFHLLKSRFDTSNKPLLRADSFSRSEKHATRRWHRTSSNRTSIVALFRLISLQNMPRQVGDRGPMCFVLGPTRAAGDAISLFDSRINDEHGRGPLVFVSFCVCRFVAVRCTTRRMPLQVAW